jgi:DNA-binding MarR family transcriptional regulator
VKSPIDRLLDRVGILRDPCDLDLLLFFSRHPRTLIATDDLAQFVGYDVQRIARALDALIAGGVVHRSQDDNHAARMYVLDATGPAGGSVLALLSVAATREGRAAVIAGLQARRAAGPTGRGAMVTERSAPRRLRVAHA